MFARAVCNSTGWFAAIRSPEKAEALGLSRVWGAWTVAGTLGCGCGCWGLLVAAATGSHCSWILRWLHRADATIMLALALVTLVGGTATVTHMPLLQTCVATSSLLQDSLAFIHICDTLTAVDEYGCWQ